MKKNKLSFEESLEQLEIILKDVEDNNLPLDELVESFEKGVELSTFCLEKLNNAKLKIDMLVKSKESFKLEKLK